MYFEINIKSGGHCMMQQPPLFTYGQSRSNALHDLLFDGIHHPAPAQQICHLQLLGHIRVFRHLRDHHIQRAQRLYLCLVQIVIQPALCRFNA